MEINSKIEVNIMKKNMKIVLVCVLTVFCIASLPIAFAWIPGGGFGDEPGYPYLYAITPNPDYDGTISLRWTSASGAMALATSMIL